MSIVYLILFVILICFILSSITGIVMFVRDVFKYSSYKSQLDNLIERYDKKLDSIKDMEETEKETDTITDNSNSKNEV